MTKYYNLIVSRQQHTRIVKTSHTKPRLKGIYYLFTLYLIHATMPHWCVCATLLRSSWSPSIRNSSSSWESCWSQPANWSLILPMVILKSRGLMHLYRPAHRAFMITPNSSATSPLWPRMLCLAEEQSRGTDVKRLLLQESLWWVISYPDTDLLMSSR